MSIGALLGMPAARGLFHKAIAQSGAAHNVLDPHVASEVTTTLMSALGATTLDDLLSASPEALVAAQDELSEQVLADPGRLGGHGGLSLAMPFQPVLDGVALPRQPLDAIREGSAAEVALVTGTTLDEWNLFHLMSPGGLDDPRLVKRLDRRFGGPVDGGGRRIAETYRVARPDASADEVWCAVLTDTVFRVPAIRLAEAQMVHQPAHTFLYLFTWASRAFDGRLGACHAVDVPFTFNVLGRAGVELLLGETTEPRSLAAAWHDAWWNFARTGDPNHPNLPTWPSYELTMRPTLAFGERIEVLHDPGSAERSLWGRL